LLFKLVCLNKKTKRTRTLNPWQGYSKVINYKGDPALQAACREAYDKHCASLPSGEDPPVLLIFQGAWLTARLEREDDAMKARVREFCAAHKANVKDQPAKGKERRARGKGRHGAVDAPDLAEDTDNDEDANSGVDDPLYDADDYQE
jgi:hypothetical protein